MRYPYVTRNRTARLTEAEKRAVDMERINRALYQRLRQEHPRATDDQIVDLAVRVMNAGMKPHEGELPTKPEGVQTGADLHRPERLALKASMAHRRT